ncbi:MAG: N-acetyl sugar amidotransferase [Bacteroidales bacterium]|nr:N-acetyl sugar amidotransferase [Bacteroidales bacterium]
MKEEGMLVSCSRCLLDETVPDIKFDSKGICNYCKKHDKLLKYYVQDNEIRKKNFNDLILKIKAKRSGEYDVIIGVSGGTDSSYTLYKAIEAGLKPLAVYFDNGWGSETAVSNIKKVTSKLDIPLYTYVVDWEEFKSIQKAFLYASVPCLEVPTDLAISSVLYKTALKENVKFIFTGASFITEGTVPNDWSFIDGAYIKDVCKKHGIKKFNSYPILTLQKILYFTFVKKIIQIPITNYFEYDKISAKEFLIKEFGWEDYGGHHYENIYSKWAFGWYTLNKFGYDKRKVSLSGPVRMGRLEREKAIEMIKNPPPINPQITDYIIKKLDLTNEEFDKIMKAPNKSFKDYNSSYKTLLKFKRFVKFAVNRDLISPVVYEKFYE